MATKPTLSCRDRYEKEFIDELAKAGTSLYKAFVDAIRAYAIALHKKSVRGSPRPLGVGGIARNITISENDIASCRAICYNTDIFLLEMKGMLTYKTKLEFETEEVRTFWVERMRLVRDCYNFASAIAYNEKTPLNLKTFHNRLYSEERERFPKLPAQMCIKIYKHVLANYRTAKANKVELEKPLEMKHPSIGLDKRLYSRMTRESFCLSTCDRNKRAEVKFVRYPKFDEMAAKYRMCDPVLQYDERSGEFYACVPFLALDTTPLAESCIGVDLGLKRIAVLSDGTAMADKEYLARRRRVRHNRRILQSHKKRSHSARTKLKRLRRRERNHSRNYCHKVANWILAHNGSVIVMEDLTKIKRTTSRTKEGVKKQRHNNRMSQVPFYELRRILTYKTPLFGKRVETVSPEYTSQEDCRTGSREGCRRHGCRFYAADGKVFDADWNAAINICNRYHPTSFGLPLDGRMNIVGRSCHETNRE